MSISKPVNVPGEGGVEELGGAEGLRGGLVCDGCKIRPVHDVHGNVAPLGAIGQPLDSCFQRCGQVRTAAPSG